MSGLDPLGRRDVRDADSASCATRGGTVFFSSHILADAETLCSRVAILAGGPAGRLGPAVRHPRVPGARAGSSSSRTSSAGAARRASRPRRSASSQIRRGPLHARAAARPSAGARARANSRRAGAHARVAEPGPRDARGLLRAARAPRPDRPRAAAQEVAHAASSAGRRQRLQGVGPRPRPLQPRRSSRCC